MTEVELREDLKAEVRATIQSWEQRRGRTVTTVHYTKSNDEDDDPLTCVVAPEMPKCRVCRNPMIPRAQPGVKGPLTHKVYYCDKIGCTLERLLVVIE